MNKNTYGKINVSETLAILIERFEQDVEDYVVYRWSNNDTTKRAKVTHNERGQAYFVEGGENYYLKDMKTNVLQFKPHHDRMNK